MNKLWKCFVLLLCVCLALSPTNAYACTGIYAGSGTTANGSVYVGRSEDYGPDYVKQYRIVPAADHAAGEMFEDDYGFRVPYPAHTLRYSVLMDDPSRYSKTAIPYGEAGINEKGVSVSATVTTNFNKKVWEKDPLTIGGLTEISMASYILQSAETARDGADILADCIDTYGHGTEDADNPESSDVSTVLIADREETWLFEIVSGHQYVATRLSDNTVSVQPNTIMAQQISTDDKDIIASPGLISTAKDGGFYVTDTHGDHEINVARSYSAGYFSATSYRYYYAAHILNREVADNIDVVPRPAAEIADLYPNASFEEIAIGPFCAEYEPSELVRGKIDLMTLKNVLASHGEGTAYETTSKNVNADGVPMRSIGTYRQAEEHIFEIRKDDSIPTSVCTIEWLAMAPSEFSVYVPFYSAAMTKTPDSYTTESIDCFDSKSVFWLFNELGNIGNGSYFRIDENGVYHDRYGKEIDAAIAEAVLKHLSDSNIAQDLHDFMNEMQEKMNAAAAAQDEEIIALAKSGSAEEVSAMADRLADENADFAKRIAKEKLAEIDKYVAGYMFRTAVKWFISLF